jgi:uncharacterized protein (DUF983 family)
MAHQARGTLLRMVGRALRRRCPNCGSRGIWKNWMNMRDACPTCGLNLDRGESDFFYGAFMFNIIAAELAVGIAFVVTLIATWPTPPWNAITWSAAGIAVIAPFLFYPFSKTLWLAVDLALRPERKQTHGNSGPPG